MQIATAVGASFGDLSALDAVQPMMVYLYEDTCILCHIVQATLLQ